MFALRNSTDGIGPADILPGVTLLFLIRARPADEVAAVGLQGNLPQSLSPFERVHNRILIWEAAQPADFREVGILAGLKCPDLQISEEVLRHVLVESHAVARRIVTNLHQIKDYARKEGKSRIEASDIAAIRWQDGKAPSPRGMM